MDPDLPVGEDVAYVPAGPSISPAQLKGSPRRLIAWMVIAVLAAIAAGLLAWPMSPTAAVTRPQADTSQARIAAEAQQGSTDALPVAPGTQDGPSDTGGATAALPAPADASAGLGDATRNLGDTRHHEIRVFAGYTVASGAVESSARDIAQRVKAEHGDLLTNITDNQGTPTIVHAEVTFQVPQSSVLTFVDQFNGDYQVYGREVSTLDRTDAYEKAQSQQILDKAEIATLAASKTPKMASVDLAAIDAKLQLLTDRIAARDAAISAATNNTNMSRVTILLDERRPVALTGISAALKLGSDNVIGVTTGVLFVLLTASPALVVLVPLWLARRRLAPRLGMVKGA